MLFFYPLYHSSSFYRLAYNGSAIFQILERSLLTTFYRAHQFGGAPEKETLCFLKIHIKL